MASLSIHAFSRDVAHDLFMLGTSAFITLFGISMAVQGARGEPIVRGFFMRWLHAIAPRLSPANVLLALLGVGVTTVLVGCALRREAEIDAGGAIILGWLAFHLQLLFHEYGHWLAGRVCGYEPYHVVGGALGLSLRGRRWHWHTNQDWRFLMGGAVFAVKPQERHWRHDFFFVAAGPLATVVLSCVRMKGSLLTEGIPTLSTFLGLSAVLGFLALVSNILPFRFGDMSSDGLQMLQLLRLRLNR